MLQVVPHVSRLPFLPIRVRGIFSYLLAMKWFMYIPMYHQLSNSGSETTRASARRSTCCHCGLCRCRCKPYTKASSLGECCTMSLSKGISFRVYALGGTLSVHGYPLVFNLG